jgi:hypothetical protein
MDEVIKPRKNEETHSRVKATPDQTRKKFVSINKPGVTEATAIPSDFAAKSVFPALRPRARADLAALTRDYYLFTHAVWFSWGNMSVDPLLEFYFKDGELNKCISRVPLKEKMIFGVARNAEELSLEYSLFAIPRDRMRDVLWWMDGVTLAANGDFQWVSARQHLALNLHKTHFDDREDTEYLAFYGFKGREHSFFWWPYKNGFAVGKMPTPPEKVTQTIKVT